MHRLSRRLDIILVAFAIAACGSKTSTSGPPALDGSARTPTPTAAKPAPSPAPFDPKTLDAAITAKGFATKDVMQRAVTARSGWAIVASKYSDQGDVTAYDVVRANAGGVATLHIVPPTGEHAWFDKDVAAPDVRDLDGNGTDDVLLVVGWLRDVSRPVASKKCKGCTVVTGEAAQQLYVIYSVDSKLAVAFTHLVSYKTNSQVLPAENSAPVPKPEQITYDWNVAGNPPVLSLKRTELEVDSKRLDGLTDVASDPLLAAGASKSVPLVAN